MVNIQEKSPLQRNIQNISLVVSLILEAAMVQIATVTVFIAM